MKTLLMSLMAVVSLMSSAQAAPQCRMLTADLNEIKMDKKHATLKPYSARVTVDLIERTIHLSVFPSMPVCPPGKLCAMVMPEPISFEVPLISVEKNECGMTEYYGIHDQRPVDGPMQEIRVLDTRGNTCQTKRRLRPTEVTLTEKLHPMHGGGESTSVSYLFGEEVLKLLPTTRGCRI